MNEKEDTVKIKSRYYCPSCAEEEKKDQVVRDKQKESWSELFEYICEVYEIGTLTGMMFKQIKDFKNDYGYTDKGIYLTLKYYYEILGNEVKEGTGLGIVIYFYEEAKKHFIEKLSVTNNEKSFEENEHINIVEIDFSKKRTFKKPLSFEYIEWEAGDETDETE
jgi:hypothetical protein